MSNACISNDKRNPEQDWQDDVLHDYALDRPVNNHPNHRAQPDRDDEEE